jgi:hypothetical protein
MFGSARRRIVVGVVTIAALALPVVGSAQPANAFPKGDFVFPFKYTIHATTTIKKLNQTISPPPGTFSGAIDIDKGGILLGHIKLPPVTFTFSPGNLAPLATATAQIVEAKPVTGKVTLGKIIRVVATSTFNLKILKVVPATPTVTLPGGEITGIGSLPIPVSPPPVNLVGNSCTTETPISVTMSGVASFTKPSTFKGIFTIPNFKTCGLATVVLNQLIPGPGNTFTATAKP